MSMDIIVDELGQTLLALLAGGLTVALAAEVLNFVTAF